jgi:type I restriction enzyme S subunit
MNVLLSIKPKYAELIKSGIKKYEFRRKVFKRTESCKVFIYSTSPVRKIIGVFDASKVHEDPPSKIWNAFGESSGLSEDEFFRYFKNCKTGFAIEIRNLVIFDEPHDPSKYFLEFNPPQSYRYFDPHQNVLPLDKSKRFAEGWESDLYS